MLLIFDPVKQSKSVQKRHREVGSTGSTRVTSKGVKPPIMQLWARSSTGCSGRQVPLLLDEGPCQLQHQSLALKEKVSVLYCVATLRQQRGCIYDVRRRKIENRVLDTSTCVMADEGEKRRSGREEMMSVFLRGCYRDGELWERFRDLRTVTDTKAAALGEHLVTVLRTA